MSAKALLSASLSAPPAVYVEDVFSTYLYTGTGSTQTITNGIDLSSEGGLVWLKSRSAATDHQLFDTARGATKELISNSTAAEAVDADTLTAFNADGFSLGADSNTNTNAATYASWTFRKAEKFFDVVTYTGNGAAGRTVPHNLGSVPGFIIIKSTSQSTGWYCYHRSLGVDKYLVLNATEAASNYTLLNSIAPTSADFTLSGSGWNVNQNGETYVAYLFAHDAGGFGDSGNDSVIKCGSYTGNGSTSGPTIDLGWEPQWVMVKAVSTTGNWFMSDTMRGQGVSGSSSQNLYANTSAAEQFSNFIAISSTGFRLTASVSDLNGSGQTYIYIAIRRGPMKTPTVGTEVFNAVTYTGTGTNSRVYTGAGFPLDAVLINDRLRTQGNSAFVDRLRGAAYLTTHSTSAETTGGLYYTSKLDSMDGYTGGTADSSQLNNTGLTLVDYFFRRAPGFFDVVAYTGTGSAQTVSHNLGVVPELMIVKNRSGGAGVVSNWWVYCSAMSDPATSYLNLDGSGGRVFGVTVLWNSTNPTSSVFSLGSYSGVNGNTETYVAYLFATLTGVSKVGSYTGTGTTLSIDCGFTAGARFVMIKRTDSTGDWYVWDTARGIISGDDSYLLLNSAATEVTNTDYIDPLSSGFQISSTAPAAINANGGSFIFLAVA